MRFIMIYMTAGDAAEARHIAETLIEKRLAACVNILGEITSHYHWNGRVEQGSEVALTAKTRADLLGAVEACVADIHSYETPCIVALPMEGGHAPFLEWIAAETAQAEP